MTFRLSSVLAGLVLIAVSACNSGDPRCTNLPGGGSYCMQETSVLPPFDVQQKVEAVFNGRHETMIVELEVDKDGMRFAGLTPFGQKVIQVSYDNREVIAQVLPDARLEPTLLLALLQLALWPVDSVRAGLDEALVLDERDGQRHILMNGNVVMEVSYTGDRAAYGDMHIVFPSAKLELDVKTLDTHIAK